MSFAVGYVFYRMKFPGGWMFGAMLGSGVLHAFGIVHGGLPIWVINIAMVGIGAMVGTRFATIGFDAFMRYLAAGVGSLAVALAIIAVFLGAHRLARRRADPGHDDGVRARARWT